MKTWHYIIIAVAALALLYLLLSRKTSILKSPSSTNNLGGTLAGAGGAATGLSNLVDSIGAAFKSDSEEEDT
jgi:hypothetical protein